MAFDTSQYFPIDKFKVTLNLAFDVTKGWNDNNAIYDWGSSADLYTFSGKFATKDYNIWARPNSNDPAIVLNNGDFLPFGTHFSGDVTGYRYPVYSSKIDYHGEYQLFNVEMIPDSSGGYSYDTTPWVSKYVSGFGIAGLDQFPVPVCTPKAEYSIQYNRAGNVIREYDRREATEHRPFKMKWSNLCGDDLRGFLVQILTVIRSNTFKIDFKTNLNRLSPWLPRDGEPLSGEYDLRLTTGKIVYSYVDGDLWDLEIEVMKWQV